MQLEHINRRIPAAHKARARRVVRRRLEDIIKRGATCQHTTTKTYMDSAPFHEGVDDQVLEGGSITLCLNPWCHKIVGSAR